MKKIKIIILDLDYTLTDSTNRINPIDQQKIIEAQKKGFQIILSTGRTFSEKVQIIAQKLKLPAYNGMAFCLNGGLLYNCKTKVSIKTTAIKSKTLEILINQIKLNKVCAFFAGNKYNQIFQLKPCWINPIVKFWSGWKIRQISEEALLKEKIIGIFIFPLFKFKKYEDFHNLALNYNLKPYRYKNYFIQISVTTKSAGLIKYLKQKKIKHNEVLVIGDSNNDLELFQEFKYTIAMGNANPILLKWSYDQTTTYKNAGVGNALEKHILNSKNSFKKE